MKKVVIAVVLSVVAFAFSQCTSHPGSIRYAKQIIKEIKLQEDIYDADPAVVACRNAVGAFDESEVTSAKVIASVKAFYDTRDRRSQIVEQITNLRKQIPQELSKKFDGNEIFIIEKADTIIAEHEYFQSR